MAAKYELNLQDYWRIIRKRRWVITFTFLTVFIITWFYSRTQPELYQASSIIRVEERVTIADLILGKRTPPPAVADAMMVKGYDVVKEVVKEMGMVKEGASQKELNSIIRAVQSSIETARMKDTQNYIRITVTTTDPQKAADIANAVAETFIVVDSREKSKQARLVCQYLQRQLELTKAKLEEAEENLRKIIGEAEVLETSESLLGRLRDMERQLTDLLMEDYTEDHPQIVALKRKIQFMKLQLKSMPESELKIERLKRDVEMHKKHYTMLKGELEKSSIAEVGEVTATVIVDRAEAPLYPVGGKRVSNLFLGTLMGITLGLIFALVREHLDTSIATIEDVEDYIKLPVLGVIPYEKIGGEKEEEFWKKALGLKKDKRREVIIRMTTLYKPKSIYAETFRTLRTNLQFSGLKKEAKTILFTSSGPQEGKSTVVINLAIAMTQGGSRVLLIDCNLRRPTLHKTFDINKEPGLSDVLIERIGWQEVLKYFPDFLRSKSHRKIIEESPILDNLKVITSGKIPPNPSELLELEGMSRLLRETKEIFDVVLLDSPPTLPVTDAGILASKVDGVVIVYEVGKTARNALYRTKLRLENLGAKIYGIVLNHLKTEADLGVTYYYHYRYYGKKKLEEEES